MINPTQQMVEALRALRIKIGTDYALVVKYQECHVMAHWIYMDTIREEAAKAGVAITTEHTYGGK